SQRCSSKRRTRGGPRRSRMGGKPCCGRFMRFLRWRAAGGGGQGRLQRYYRRGAYLVVNDAAAVIIPDVRSLRMALPGAGRTFSAPSSDHPLPFDASKEVDPMKLAIPDMISNSYFPAEAAIELGFFKAEGLDVSLELIFPVDKAYAALRDGAVDFVGGSAHSALATCPD